MKTKFILMTVAVLVANQASAGKVYYNASYASSYAKNNVNKSYVPNTVYSDESKHRYLNPWGDYYHQGGNCTNFTSQAILGGLVKTASAWSTYKSRYNYTKDSSWYWKGLNQRERGYAFTGANEFYKYANGGYRSRGLTLYSERQSNLAPGDIASVKWKGDSRYGHTAMVTKTTKTSCGWKWWCTPELKSYVTYQNGSGYSAKKDYAMSSLLRGSSESKFFWPNAYRN